MPQKLPVTLVVLLAIFYGCQKNISEQTKSPAAIDNSNIIIETVDTTGRWYGTYKSIFSDPDVFPDTVSEVSLIRNGEASLNELPPGEYWLSSVGYYIPADKKISGDSTTFTAVVTDNEGVVQLDIIGSRNIVHSACVKNKADSSTITLSAGKSMVTSVVKPAIDFSAFRNVSLIVKENKAVFMIGNLSKAVLAFKDADRPGRIKLLSAGFDDQPQLNSRTNGELTCTAVRLFNSYSHRAVMKETFSLNGKSHTVFY